MREYLVNILDEQHSVGFTGKINVLDPNNKQILGDVAFHEGQIFLAKYKGVKGLKAFYNLCIDEFEDVELQFIVEPELVDISKREIHFPYSVLKRKISETVERFKESKSNRPPGHLKILIRPDFLVEGDEITGEEYDLLCTLSDYNLVSDVYKFCDLLDYEITNALVSLRKKNALTVVKKNKMRSL